MIKLKKILKEAAWDHTSGKALPTLEDVQKAYDAKKGLQEEVTEAAPKMKSSPFVADAQAAHKQIFQIENQMKIQDPSGYSRTKGEFKKAQKAIGNLTSAIRSHGKNY